MEIERRVLGNAASLGVGAVIAQLANFGFVILVARGFGREIFAQYALSMVVGGLACLLITFGTISLLTRCSAQDFPRSIEMLKSVLPVQVTIALLLWVLVVGGASLVTPSREDLVIFGLILAHHAVLRISGVLLAYLHGRERMQTVALVKTGSGLTMLAAGALLAFMTGSPVAGIAAMPATGLLFLAYTNYKVKALTGHLEWRWDPAGAWDVAKQAFPFFLILAVTAASDRLGPLMLSAIRSPDALATYASGERILTAVAMLYTMLAAASLPAASRFAEADRERFEGLVNRMTRLISLAVLPVATALFLFSDDIIALLFGGDFMSSAPVLRIVAFLFAIRGINSVQSMAAISLQRQRDVLVGRGFALAIVVLVAPAVIWRWGATGLACIMVVAEGAYSVIVHLRLRRIGVRLSLAGPAVRTMIACTAGAVAGLAASDLGLPARIVIVGTTTAAGLWMTRAVRAHDLRYLVAILKTPRSAYEETG